MVRIVHLTADGELIIKGHDLGPGVERHFGHREYEFQRRLSAAQTQRLWALLDASDPDSLLHVIGERFSDTFHLERFLEDNDIPSEFWSRVGD